MRCELLVKNLPGLTYLNLCNIVCNQDYNNLSDLAVYSVSQLHHISELRIGMYTNTYPGNNDIGDKAAELIATLPLLIKLHIGNNEE